MVEETPQITLDETEILADQPEDQTPVEADTTDSDSSPEEVNAEATTEVEEPTTDKETEDSEEDAPADTDEVVETKDDQPKFETAEQRKTQLNEDIRSLVSKRNQIRAENEALIAQTYKVPTAQEIYDADQSGEITPEMARIEAMEKRDELRSYAAQVTDTTATVTTESLQALADFPLFDPAHPNHNADLTSLADVEYQKVAGIQQDPQTGLFSRVAVAPYDFYKTIAKAYEVGASTTQVKAQRSAEKMLAAADTPTSVAPKAAKDDPFLKGFDSKYRQA